MQIRRKTANIKVSTDDATKIV